LFVVEGEDAGEDADEGDKIASKSH